MALITCKECKQQVSTQAKNCPGCGAKVIKPTSKLNIIFALAVLALMIKCSVDKPPSTRDSSPVRAATASDIAEQRADSARFDAAYELAKAVRQHAKDPASVAFAQIGVSEDARLVCATYRAKNSFNAVVPGVAVIAKNTIYFEQSQWNKHCAKASGLYDQTAAGG